MISIDNYDFKGKRAIIRVDFNVPLNEKGEVTDDTRIRAAIPTIKKVLAEGGSVILMSHMGRPKKNPDPKYSLEQIVPAVEKNLGTKVEFAGDCIGEKAAEMAKNLKPGQVMLLENLRFYAEEEGKPRGLAEDASKEEKDAAKKALKEGPQKEFVKKLASLADCYINDAFGTAQSWDVLDPLGPRQLRLLVNIDLADSKAVRVFLSNLLIRRADLPAIAAPWRPEIHQNRLFLPDQLLKLLLIHIHSCHICQLLSFVWVFSRLRSRPTPHCDLILR